LKLGFFEVKTAMLFSRRNSHVAENNNGDGLFHAKNGFCAKI